MPSASIQLLQNFYLFKDLTPSEVEQVNQLATLETFHPGDEIFCEGDEATAVYIIKYGSVKIRHAGKSDIVNVATLASGAHFGEMSFLDREKRSATVEAIERADLVKIEFEALRKLLDSNTGMAIKVYRALATFLCGRLRLTTTDLTFAREKSQSRHG